MGKNLIGQLEYLVLSNDNADIVSSDDWYKYIDELTLQHLVCLSGLLTEYSFTELVASDIGIAQSYLPADSYQTQAHLKCIPVSNILGVWISEDLSGTGTQQ